MLYVFVCVCVSAYKLLIIICVKAVFLLNVSNFYMYDSIIN